MKLKQLLSGIEIIKTIGEFEDIEIDALCDNTKKLQKHCLFVAIVGLRVDAHHFCAEAIKAGAVALIVERELPIDCVQIVVKNTKEALGILAKNFYDNPLENIKIIGIVGTNGKTTTAHIIAQLLTYAGKVVGVIGTTGVQIGGQLFESSLTTPDTLELFELFSKMQKSGVQVIVIELSAHAIKLKKVCAFVSDIAIFTNFSQDHLDFFESMDEYEATKRSYFENGFCKCALINADDAVGQKLLKNISVPRLSFGLGADFQLIAKQLELSAVGSKFMVEHEGENVNIELALPGKFNVYNALAAFGACRLLGLKKSDLAQYFKRVTTPSGRFNIVEVGKNFRAVIDYAHTPVALENLLSNVKDLTNGDIICVFGCPGCRDESKRSIMGKIAGKYCSLVVLTSDNPDLENPLKIMTHIEEGLKKTKCPYLKIEDRKKAILCALERCKAQKSTTIVIAGKGHERCQIINNCKLPYNDMEELLKLLQSAGFEKKE